MSWEPAIAPTMAALLAIAHAVCLCLARLYRLEQHVLDGRGLSPSLLLALGPGEGA